MLGLRIGAETWQHNIDKGPGSGQWVVYRTAVTLEEQDFLVRSGYAFSK